MSGQCDHKSYTLGEICVSGKPVLLEAGSLTGGIMMIKEEAWKEGTEATLIEADIEFPDTIQDRINAVPEGGFLIISDTASATPDVLDVIKTNLTTPRRLVITERHGYKAIDKKEFTDLGGHTVKF